MAEGNVAFVFPGKCDGLGDETVLVFPKAKGCDSGAINLAQTLQIKKCLSLIHDTSEKLGTKIMSSDTLDIHQNEGDYLIYGGK